MAQRVSLAVHRVLTDEELLMVKDESEMLVDEDGLAGISGSVVVSGVVDVGSTKSVAFTPCAIERADVVISDCWSTGKHWSSQRE